MHAGNIAHRSRSISRPRKKEFLGSAIRISPNGFPLRAFQHRRDINKIYYSLGQGELSKDTTIVY